MIRTYTELSKLRTFRERYEYLRLLGIVGESTFGHDRYLNQLLYHSQKWADARNAVIIRDDGCDLGIPGYEIYDRIYVHHMNPISLRQIESGSSVLYDPEGLICTSFGTHQAIHFGDEHILPVIPGERTPGDTTLW